MATDHKSEVKIEVTMDEIGLINYMVCHTWPDMTEEEKIEASELIRKIDKQIGIIEED